MVLHRPIESTALDQELCIFEKRIAYLHPIVIGKRLPNMDKTIAVTTTERVRSNIIEVWSLNSCKYQCLLCEQSPHRTLPMRQPPAA
jgi:hypothetical protein